MNAPIVYVFLCVCGFEEPLRCLSSGLLELCFCLLDSYTVIKSLLLGLIDRFYSKIVVVSGIIYCNHAKLQIRRILKHLLWVGDCSNHMTHAVIVITGYSIMLVVLF